MPKPRVYEIAKDLNQSSKEMIQELAKYGVENRENGVEFWFTLDASNEVPELMNPGEVK